MPAGARQSDDPANITSELSGQTTLSSKSGRLISVILFHIDRYVMEWPADAGNKSGTAEDKSLCLLMGDRGFFCIFGCEAHLKEKCFVF